MLPGQKNNSLQLLFGAKENLLLAVKGSPAWREIIISSAAGWESAQTQGKQIRKQSLGIYGCYLYIQNKLCVGVDQKGLTPREKK